MWDLQLTLSLKSPMSTSFAPRPAMLTLNIAPSQSQKAAKHPMRKWWIFSTDVFIAKPVQIWTLVYLSLGVSEHYAQQHHQHQRQQQATKLIEALVMFVTAAFAPKRAVCRASVGAPVLAHVRAMVDDLKMETKLSLSCKDLGSCFLMSQRTYEYTVQ
jgi:hypothetical protein